MSRLQAGALALDLQPIDVADVVPAAVDSLGPPASGVAIRIPDEVPDVTADPALLERALANLVANALRFSPPDAPPSVTASALGDRVELRVVDRGPGIPREDWDRVFLPFQRLGDRDNTVGVGLGLALSRGLVEAMGGTLDARGDTRWRPHHDRQPAGRPRGPAARRRRRAPARTGWGRPDDTRPRRRRRTPDPARAADQPARPAVPRRHGRHRRRGPAGGGGRAPRPRDPRPRAARHGRRRRGPRPARLDAGADRRPVGPDRTAPTRSTRSTPAPTTT